MTEHRLSKAQIASNLYDWLPPYGASRSSFVSQITNVIITINYEIKEDETDKSIFLKRDIIFENVSFFYKTPIPGITLFSIEKNDKIDYLDNFYVFLQSDFIDKINNTFDNQYYQNSKQYRLGLLGDNVFYDIIAKGFYISEEIKDDR